MKSTNPDSRHHSDPALAGRGAGCGSNETSSLHEAAPDRVSARPELTITTLGFGSCARQERPQPIWDTINAARCDAFVLLGDNIYADTSDPAVFREKYALLAAMPGFAKLRQTTPLFATWDDHDYGINDGGAGFPGAAVAQKEFCDFFQVPATSPLRTTPGVYDCVTLGPVGKRVQLILLDTRMFRSPLKKDPPIPRSPSPTPTPTRPCSAKGSGPGSSAACANRPKSVWWFPASSSIANEHGSEKWENFPKERARFLELLRRTQAKGVVVISGDRHMAELSALTPADGVPYPLYDLTTSGLNLPIPQKPAAQGGSQRARDQTRRPQEASGQSLPSSRASLHGLQLRPHAGQMGRSQSLPSPGSLRSGGRGRPFPRHPILGTPPEVRLKRAAPRKQIYLSQKVLNKLIIALRVPSNAEATSRFFVLTSVYHPPHYESKRILLSRCLPCLLRLGRLRGAAG